MTHLGPGGDVNIIMCRERRGAAQQQNDLGIQLFRMTKGLWSFWITEFLCHLRLRRHRYLHIVYVYISPGPE